MRRRAAGRRDGVAMIVGLLLLHAACELQTQGTSDRSLPDASFSGASGGGGRLDAGPDRDGLDATVDGEGDGEGGSDEDASDAADATDSSPVCGVDPVPPGRPVCPPECGGCPENKCRLTCTTALSCQNEIVRCPEGFECEITCAGPGSCVGALVLCDARHRCGMICEGLDACRDATMQCGDGSCGLLCLAGSCSETTLNCGSGDCLNLCVLPPYPRVNCFDSCSCKPC
ncbi:MAG TPA: hypothetical protein VI072_16130 [Polyangiaceae bacterium]